MANVLTLSELGRSSSSGRVKPKSMKLVYVGSALST